VITEWLIGDYFSPCVILSGARSQTQPSAVEEP